MQDNIQDYFIRALPRGEGDGGFFSELGETPKVLPLGEVLGGVKKRNRKQ
jgi:hypothetical protein